MRTHYCGQINESLFDENVELYGWVHSYRNHGGLIFIDLRDREGVVQIVAHPEHAEMFAIADRLRSEDVVQVRGIVRPRPLEMINEALFSGKAEIECLHIELLSKAAPLPFQIDEYQKTTNEELRLKYRYIDLRRPEMIQRIILRAKAAKVLRHYLDKQGFIEVETPLLTKSTPEGARDYLVPSRNYLGSFYALPQSPQIFKQLLMMGGLDRYYQIVRCFRDEDLRADRQPEFTQLDIEMSFMQEKEIQQLLEAMMRELFMKVLNIALPNPFPRMTYEEALDRFGTDKPDLRIPLELVDIDDLVRDSEFEIFADAASKHTARVAALRLPRGAVLSRKQIDDYNNFVVKCGAKGLAYMKIYDLQAGIAGIKSPIAKFLTEKMLKDIVERTKAEVEDIIFFGADEIKIVNESLGALSFPPSANNA